MINDSKSTRAYAILVRHAQLIVQLRVLQHVRLSNIYTVEFCYFPKFVKNSLIPDNQIIVDMTRVYVSICRVIVLLENELEINMQVLSKMFPEYSEDLVKIAIAQQEGE